MNNPCEMPRRQLEQSGEVLREKEDAQAQSDANRNLWEDSMKDMPSFEEHMSQMESEDEMSM